MKQYVQIECPDWASEDVVKNGKSENGTQRYRCHACRRSFQWEYTYTAWLPGVKEQIEEQTLNSSGVRAMSRNLGIAKNTVLTVLKKKSRQKSMRRLPSISPQTGPLFLISRLALILMNVGVLWRTHRISDGPGARLIEPVVPFWRITSGSGQTRRVLRC